MVTGRITRRLSSICMTCICLPFFVNRLRLAGYLLAAKRAQTEPLTSEGRTGSIGATACSLMVLSGFTLFCGTVASADNALVLPRGRMSVKLEHLLSFPVSERWNPEGTAEELAGAFDGRALDSSVFPTLTVA